MKNKILILLTALLYLPVVNESTADGNKQLTSIPLSNKLTEFAPVKVVELFSSESCYDCPKSDLALNELVELTKDRQDVIILAEHVDYWDDLLWGEGKCKGIWKDPYSNGFLTQRQFRYAQANNTSSATPQTFINGNKHKIDPHLTFMKKEIDKISKNKMPMHIDISLNEESSASSNLTINYHLKKNWAHIIFEKKKNKSKKRIIPQLQLFVIEKGLIAHPTVAENCNKKWLHQNIVRAYKAVTVRNSKSGKVNITLPTDININNTEVNALVQNAYGNKFEILGASKGFKLTLK